MNKDWHAQNKMPRNATMEQRISWHLEHAEKCACREIPPGLRAMIGERALTQPGRAPPETSGTGARSHRATR